MHPVLTGGASRLQHHSGGAVHAQRFLKPVCLQSKVLFNHLQFWLVSYVRLTLTLHHIRTSRILDPKPQSLIIYHHQCTTTILPSRLLLTRTLHTSISPRLWPKRSEITSSSPGLRTCVPFEKNGGTRKLWAAAPALGPQQASGDLDGLEQIFGHQGSSSSL